MSSASDDEFCQLKVVTVLIASPCSILVIIQDFYGKKYRFLLTGEHDQVVVVVRSGADQSVPVDVELDGGALRHVDVTVADPGRTDADVSRPLRLRLDDSTERPETAAAIPTSGWLSRHTHVTLFLDDALAAGKGGMRSMAFKDEFRIDRFVCSPITVARSEYSINFIIFVHAIVQPAPYSIATGR